MADGQRVLGEVDCRPLQPDHLASPESVVSCKEDGDIDLVILDQLEQLLHFLGIVVGGDELLLPRSVGLVDGIARYDPPLYRILERFMEHTVVALTGGALQPCVTKVGVEFVDLIPRQVLDGEVEGREEFADAPVVDQFVHGILAAIFNLAEETLCNVTIFMPFLRRYRGSPKTNACRSSS